MQHDLSELTDEQLVLKVCNEDQEYYAEIIRRYEKKLLSYARYLVTSDGFDHEEAVQGIFLKAFINLQSFDTKRKFSSWIYRIAHNEIMNGVKREKLRQSEDISLYHDTVAGNEDTVREVEELLNRKAVDDCLAALPVKYREALVLFYFNQYSYDEMSDILHIPTKSVGTLLHRGKKLLRAVCEQQGVV